MYSSDLKKTGRRTAIQEGLYSQNGVLLGQQMQSKGKSAASETAEETRRKVLKWRSVHFVICHSNDHCQLQEELPTTVNVYGNFEIR